MFLQGRAMSKRSLKLRELLKKLKRYGVRTLSKKERGKGSEIILLKPNNPDSKRGAQFPIKNHGAGTEIYIPVINAILRRFNIDPDDFWK